jgi:hypothetical protein
MEIPASFQPIDHLEGLVDKIQKLGYLRTARFVAFWWEECDNQLAWADSNLKVALGCGDNDLWLSEVRPVLSEFALGSAHKKAEQVLVWDRHRSLLWIAPRQEGIMFLTTEEMSRRYGNGHSR